jgi:aryl-alcohol dehydrogenase-like predicted oxidoreductase
MEKSYIFQALKQLPREKIQVATKFGVQMSVFPHMTVNGSPDYVRSCCEASLKRLDVEYIDLYYQHRIDTNVPIEETVSDSLSLSTRCLQGWFLISFLFVIKMIKLSAN